MSEQEINELPNTDEKIIDTYLRKISNEIKADAQTIGIQKARQNANKKYGKFWRERLTAKKIYNAHNPFDNISYH